jgi:hypothetical protein
VSPSKKANKKVAEIKSRSAAKTSKPSVRSSRAAKIKPLKARGRSASQASLQISPAPVQAIQPEVSSVRPASRFQTNILRVIALLVVIGITIYIYSIRDRVEQFKEYGYLGIFLVALLANATILLPAPGVAVIYAMGAVFNPLGVGLLSVQAIESYLK